MKRLALGALAALVSARALAAALPAPPSSGDVEIRADALARDAEGRLAARGNVEVRRGAWTLRCDEAAFDGAGKLASARGHVVVSAGEAVAIADAAEVKFTPGEVALEGATLYVKQGVDPALLSAATAAQAPLLGHNALTVRARTLRQLGGGLLEATDVSLTPCDCPDGAPDFRLTATSATLEPDVATLRSPALWLFGLRIPLVVPLPVPLSERRTGLLFPKLVPWGASGFGVDLPLFVTLGPSWDLTLDAGGFTGRDPAAIAPERGVKGPRGGVEVRYAPSDTASGKVAFSDQLDLVPGHDAAFRGNRWYATWTHRSALPGGGRLAVDGAVASDSAYFLDTTTDLLRRGAESLRSDAAAEWRRDGLLTSVGASAFQDLRGGLPMGPLVGAAAPTTFQRLPSVQLMAPLFPVPIAPAALGALAVSLTRFAPWTAAAGGEGVTGFGPLDACATCDSQGTPGSGEASAAARAPVVRLDLSRRLLLPLSLGDYALLTPELGGRADAYWFETPSSVPPRDRARVYGWGGATLETELSRTFADGLRHAIRPSVAWRLLPPAASVGGPPIGDPVDGGGPSYAAALLASQQGLPRDLAHGILGVPAARRAYDELDGAATEAGSHQLVAAVETELDSPGAPGAPPRRLVTAALGQDVRLTPLWGGPSGPGEAWARASALLPWLPSGRVLGEVRYQWAGAAPGVSYATAGANAGDRRGDEAHAAASFLASGAGDRLRAGVDELFASTPPPTALGAAAPVSVLSAGGRVRLPAWVRPGLSLRYDVAYFPAGAVGGTALYQHDAGVSYDSPCGCAAASLSVTVQRFGANTSLAGAVLLVDLKQLGSLGGGL